MIRINKRLKLQLSKETVRHLTKDDLGAVPGGAVPTTGTLMIGCTSLDGTCTANCRTQQPWACSVRSCQPSTCTAG